jgi:hypothetical protein
MPLWSGGYDSGFVSCVTEFGWSSPNRAIPTTTGKKFWKNLLTGIAYRCNLSMLTFVIVKTES